MNYASLDRIIGGNHVVSQEDPVSYPWIHVAEMAAARAEAAAGDVLGDEGRAYQRQIGEGLEADPEFRAWADAKYMDRYGIPRGRPAAAAEI
jgi:hypothetical protein